MVGNDVELMILSIQGDQVKLGFSAPKNVTIHRKEIYEMIQEENKEASSSNININLAALNQAALKLKQ